MEVLARNFSPGKWAHADPEVPGQIAADAITADLRTAGNTLSFWSCADSSKVSIEKAALALTAARAKVEKIDLLYLTSASVREVELPLIESAGHAPVIHLRRTHRDMCGLDLRRLGVIASLVARAIKAGQWYRFSRPQVLHLLASAARSGQVEVADLSEAVRRDVEVALTR